MSDSVRHTRSIVLALTLLAPAVNPSLLSQNAFDPCSVSALPSAIGTVLKVNFVGWRPRQISDLVADDQQLWAKAHSQSCPGIASGHFDGGSRLEYALLLVPMSNSGSYRLALFRENSAGTFVVRVLAHSEGDAGSKPVISKVPPGKYSDPENGKTVRTKADSILLEWIEAAARLYYWSGSAFHELQVED